jgi:hypothetical protein
VPFWAAALYYAAIKQELEAPELRKLTADHISSSGKKREVIS